MMQDAIKHSGGQHRLAGEGPVPAAEDHRSLLVASRNDLEEQVRLLATEGQIADLIDDQELGIAIVRYMISFIRPCRLAASSAMARSAAEVNHTFPASVRREQTERDREVGMPVPLEAASYCRVPGI
jgi:hypothetical protein